MSDILDQLNKRNNNNNNDSTAPKNKKMSTKTVKIREDYYRALKEQSAQDDERIASKVNRALKHAFDDGTL